MKLRDYQTDAVAAGVRTLTEQKGNPVIEMATGLGKSVIPPALSIALLKKWPGIRVLVLCHRAKLVEQDAEKFMQMGLVPAIFCAELGRKEVGQFTVGTIGSVARRPELFADFHLVICDECQMINNEDEGLWRNFLKSLPKAKVIGMSATPYRLKGGAVYGANRIFSHRCYQMGFAVGVRRGFLTPPINYDANWQDNYDDIRISGGDFNQKDMNEHFNKIVKRSVADLIKRMEERNYILVFACSIVHAEAIVAELTARGEKARVYHSEMSLVEDKMTIQMFQNRQFKYLVSIDKLGVGFDAPFIDGLALMRPTMSRGLAIQQLGRGSRLYEGKENFLVADYAGNVVRHNLLNPDLYDVPASEISKPKKTGGDAPFKRCPTCDEINHTRTTVCSCGYIFPPKIKTQAEYDAEGKTIQINGWTAAVESNSKHSYVVLTVVGSTVIDLYKFHWFPDDEGFAKTKTMMSFQKLFGFVPEHQKGDGCHAYVKALNNMGHKYRQAEIQKEAGFWKLKGVI